MIHLFRMAFRDLGRNRRRSFFSSLALAIGLALLLMMAAVLNGEMRGAMEATIRLQSGHLQVRAQSYEPGKSSLAWDDLIEDPNQVASQIASLPPVKVATPRLLASGMISIGDDSTGVGIIGLDPESEASAPYRDGMLSGEYLTVDDRNGILVGQAMAEKNQLNAGDEITLLVNTSNGDMDAQPFTIRGIFTTGVPAYDKSTVIMPIAKAQTIGKAENHASLIFVLLNDSEQADPVATAIHSGKYDIKTWKQLNELVIQVEEFANSYMVVLYFIILAITSTVIINTLIMAVFERTREIGILSSLGMKASRILAMFLAESTLLAIGGIAMGLVLGGLIVAYLTRYGIFIGDLGTTGMLLGERIYAHLTLDDTITLTITALVVALLAALYPAMLASRMEPVDALRGGK